MKLFDVFATLRVDDNDFNRKMGAATKSGEGFARKISAGTGKALITVSKLAAAATAAAAAGIGVLGKIGNDYNSKIEDYTTNFSTMLGSVERGTAKVRELSEMAAKTPFALDALADATQTLLAFNVTSDKSTGVLKQLGDISLGNADKLTTLTRAYGKMSSTGKVTLESVQMMIEAGFNPLTLICDKTGLTMDQLYTKISQGKVPFSEIEWAMQKATSEGGQFFGGMENASKTQSGLISTLKDNWAAFLGKLFSPVSEEITGTVLPWAIDKVDALSAALDKDGLQGVLTEAETAIQDVIAYGAEKAPQAIGIALRLLSGFVLGIILAVPSVAGAVKLLLPGLTKGVKDMSPTAGKAVAELMIGAFQALTGTDEEGNSTLGNIASIVPDFINGFLAKMVDYIGSEEAAEDLSAFAAALVSGIGNMFAGLETFAQLATQLASELAAKLSTDEGKEQLKVIAIALLQGVLGLAAAVIQALPELATAAADIAGALADAVVEALAACVIGEENVKKIKAWWQGLDNNGGLLGAIKQTITDNPPKIDVRFPLTSDVMALFDPFWQGKDGEGGLFKRLYELMRIVLGIDPPGVDDTAKALRAWWENTKQAAGQFLIDLVVPKWLKNLMHNNGEGGSSTFSTQDPDFIGPPAPGATHGGGGGRSFEPRATGLPRVPYDGYRALLHRDEAVLTRAEAARWREGAGVGGGQTITVNQSIQAVAMSPEDIKAQTVSGLRAMRFAI